MMDGIDSITGKAVLLALEAASMRQQVISANIANANVAGYVPLRVNFEGQLDEARRILQQQGALDRFSPLEGVRPHVEPVSAGAGQPAKVQLDQEMVDLARNALHYQALLKGLSRQMGILTAAISEGKK